MKRTLLECLAVVLIGCAVGLAANALSPKGISIGRNYFPGTTGVVATNVPPVTGAAVTNRGSQTQPGVTNVIAIADPVASRLAAQGLELVDRAFVEKSFSDSRFQQGLIVFIDARNDDLFKKGHIPGAHQFDYYRPEPYLPKVLPAVTVAELVIVYCNGGNCEDSELAAVFLRNAGVPASKLRVYHGGF